MTLNCRYHPIFNNYPCCFNMAINEWIIGYICLCVYYGYVFTYVDVIISIINFIVIIISCASNYNNCLELINSNLLKHCYHCCCIFSENKHDMHLIVRLIIINIFILILHCNEVYELFFSVICLYLLFIFGRRRIIFQPLSFFLKYFNSLCIIVIEFVL